MTNIEKYNAVFKKILRVTNEELEALERDVTEEWNSMAQIAIVAELEEAFGISFRNEDIFKLRSYAMGKEMLRQQFNIEL